MDLSLSSRCFSLSLKSISMSSGEDKKLYMKQTAFFKDFFKTEIKNFCPFYIPSCFVTFLL